MTYNHNLVMYSRDKNMTDAAILVRKFCNPPTSPSLFGVELQLLTIYLFLKINVNREQVKCSCTVFT